ncbi:MAG: LptF/LptG family permease [bacterium]|nr:LptF/LptG family permease [bacterium]
MILDRYILKNYIGPFLFSTSVLTFVFVMDFILRYIDLFLNKGVEFLVVMQAFMLSLGHMFALIIPMAVLPATLMTFSTLAGENEVTAMKAGGLSLARTIRPVVLLGAALTLGMIFYNNNILPEANHKLLNLLIDINKKKPTVVIKENRFIDAFKGYKIFVRHKNDRTGEIREIQIFQREKPGELPTTIIAERGFLRYEETDNVLLFELEDGEIHKIPDGTDASTYRRTVFKTYTLKIADIDRSLKRTERNYRGDREMNVQMMYNRIKEIEGDIVSVDAKVASMASTEIRNVMSLLNSEVRDSVLGSNPSTAVATTAAGLNGSGKGRSIASKRKTTVTKRALQSQQEIKVSYLRQINRYRVEIHKKFAISFACLVFVLIGSPIALSLGKSGMNTAIILSIIVFLVYYICLIGGEKLADRRIVSPIFAMWVPNLFFGICSVILIRRATREQIVIDWGKMNPLRILQRG